VGIVAKEFSSGNVDFLDNFGFLRNLCVVIPSIINKNKDFDAAPT